MWKDPYIYNCEASLLHICEHSQCFTQKPGNEKGGLVILKGLSVPATQLLDLRTNVQTLSFKLKVTIYEVCLMVCL